MATAFGLELKAVEPKLVIAPPNDLVENPSPRFKLDLKEYIPENKMKKSATFPARYDLREKGLVTSVKNQGIFETCWAHAACAAGESAMIKLGYANSTVDYSEANLVNFMYNRVNDPLGNTAGDKNFILNGQTPANFSGYDIRTFISLSGR